MFVNTRVLDSFYKKGKKIKKENERVANRKLGKLIPSFVVPNFRFFPTAKIKNSDLKIFKKNFRDFRGFQVFELAGTSS